MRTVALVVSLGITAVSAAGAGQTGDPAKATSIAVASAPSTALNAPPASASGPFAGAWSSCDGATSPDECSRYLLIQRGERICGTWSYLASGQTFEGRLVAHATSETKARRTQVCGRAGSETDTECADGWQNVDAPLRLCDGKLSDLAATDGACLGVYQAAPVLPAERAALEAQPWMAACLAAPL